MIPKVTEKVLINTCSEVTRDLPVGSSEEIYNDFIDQMKIQQPAIFEFIGSFLDDAVKNGENPSPAFMTIITIIKSLYNQHDEDIRSN